MNNKVMAVSHDELRDLFVGRMERLTADQVERGEISPSEARFHVGVAESSFKYMVEVVAEEGIRLVREVKSARQRHRVRCTESNSVPVPSKYEGRGYCGTCGDLAILKQNGRLPVHWRAGESSMALMREARGW